MEIKFLGIGSAWNTILNNTSAFYKNNSKLLLIDCGENIAKVIIENNILKDVKELYILISHTHSDHIGSLGTILFYSRYKMKIKNYLVMPKNEEYRKNIQEYLRLVEITNEVDFINGDRLKKQFKLNNFQFIVAKHVNSFPCYSFLFEDNEGLIYFSADNSEISNIIKFSKINNSKIYTEICSNKEMNDEHLYYQILDKSVRIEDRKRIYLMHIDEQTDIDELIRKGFQIPKALGKKEGKKMEEKKIRMDQEGFEKFKLEIKKTEDELAEVRLYKGTTAIYQGDNWHDNPELYQTEAKERSLMQTLARMKEQLDAIEIVERNLESDIVDVGDIVKIDTIFAEDDVEELTIKLVGGYGDLKSEIQEVSIDSPLGASIYGEKVSDSVSYKVNNNVFNVVIKEKVVSLEKTDTEHGFSKSLKI